MPLTGSAVVDTNPRLNFLVLVFLSTIAFGVLLFWRDRFIYSQDYVEIPSQSSHIAKKQVTPSPTNEVRKELSQ